MAAICGLQPWIGIHRNDQAAYLNNMLLVAVNGSFAIFAFLSNLAIIFTIIKTPSLQKPCNILLCNLAVADCLTGVSLSPCSLCGDFFFKEPSSHVYIKLWCLTCITLYKCLPSAYRLSTF